MVCVQACFVEPQSLTISDTTPSMLHVAPNVKQATLECSVSTERFEWLLASNGYIVGVTNNMSIELHRRWHRFSNLLVKARLLTDSQGFPLNIGVNGFNPQAVHLS